jgi:hypothetical protein
MPYSGEEKAALEAQALCAIVLSGAPFQLFEDLEMKILFGMMRTTAPEAIPSAKVIGGRLLDTAAEGVDEKVKKVMKARLLGLWYVRSSILSILTYLSVVQYRWMEGK